MKKDKSLKRGIYKHYKGNLYEVIEIAKHSETEEWMVIYRTLYGDATTWVRPFDMFVESIELEGSRIKRFEYMGKQ